MTGVWTEGGYGRAVFGVDYYNAIVYDISHITLESFSTVSLNNVGFRFDESLNLEASSYFDALIRHIIVSGDAWLEFTGHSSAQAQIQSIIPQLMAAHAVSGITASRDLYIGAGTEFHGLSSYGVWEDQVFAERPSYRASSTAEATGYLRIPQTTAFYSETHVDLAPSLAIPSTLHANATSNVYVQRDLFIDVSMEASSEASMTAVDGFVIDEAFTLYGQSSAEVEHDLIVLAFGLDAEMNARAGFGADPEVILFEPDSLEWDYTRLIRWTQPPWRRIQLQSIPDSVTVRLTQPPPRRIIVTQHRR